MPQEDQRNFIIAMVLMIGVIWGYQEFVIAPDQEARRAAQEAARSQVEDKSQGINLGPTLAVSVEEALKEDQRISFDGRGIDGSIRVKGARIDDLKLKRHFLTTERVNELRLFRPENSKNGYYASFNWVSQNNRSIVGDDTEWEVRSVKELTPSSPVILETIQDNLRIQRTISLDDNYLFTIDDRITNRASSDKRLRPVGSVRRHGKWEEFLEATDPGSSRNNALVHQGLIGVLNGELKLRKYKGLSEGKGIKDSTISPIGGWLGLTDKYWMGALIPSAGIEFDGKFTRIPRQNGQVLEVNTFGTEFVIEPGQTIEVTNRIFAGAKRLSVLQEYQDSLSLTRFDDAVDWGMLYFLTKPFFQILLWLQGYLNSFGWAILAFTVLIKIPLIPLYNTSFKAMAKLKKLAEPMKDIRERFAADPQRQQQEIMKLYKREKANPVTGCLPIFATIPIFYALYKTLIVTLEMRHEPFWYIKDLSAPDPTAIGNLFGLLPWAASDVKSIPILGFIIGIGIMPIIYGVSMFILQSLNPPPPDKTQRIIFGFLPIIFTFIFAGFAAGLVLYWVWNNILTLIQQYYIMRRNGAETEIGKFIAKYVGKYLGRS